MKTETIRDFIKKGLKESSFENYLNPRYNLGHSDKIGAPSKLAKSLIEDKVEISELMIEFYLTSKQKGYEPKAEKLRKEIRKLKGKENYHNILEECQESKRKAIEGHKRYFLNYNQ